MQIAIRYLMVAVKVWSNLGIPGIWRLYD